MPGTLHDNETVTSAPALRSVALIGPNESSRHTMARGLANSGGASVREFLAYPATLADVPVLLDQKFHMVLVEVDTDESYALALIAALAAPRTCVVMAYSQRNPQDLILRCMQAGARDFFFVPAEEETEAAADPEPPESSTPAPEPPAPAARTASLLTFPAPPAPAEPVPAEPVAAEPVPLPAAAPLPDPLPAAPEVLPAAVAPSPEYDRPIFGQIGFEPPKRHPLRLILAGFATLLFVCGLAFAFMPQLQPARTGLLVRLGVHAAQPAAAPAPAPSPASAPASGDLNTKP